MSSNGGGGVQPHFSPRHTEIWIWGWTKMGKKCMKREGNKLPIFKIEKNPIFSHMMCQNLDLGMEKNVKNWGKKYMEREGKVFILTDCTLSSLFSAF